MPAAPEREGEEKLLVLVKALPHVGDRHGETVCCAGITESGEWRRLFPVIFRSLSRDKQFKRWQWIKYRWRKPRSDRRPESRHIQEDTIEIVGQMRAQERTKFLTPLVLDSVETAKAQGQTLALVRPQKPRFYWVPKSQSALAAQRREYEAVANQLSFFSADRKAFAPCPYEFKFEYRLGSEVQARTATCDDWETSAMFYRFQRLARDDDEALEKIQKVFGEQYPEKGMAFAMGTHSRFPEIWLLVGVIRLDDTPQLSLNV